MSALDPTKGAVRVPASPAESSSSRAAAGSACQDVRMSDMRRTSPDPPAGLPEIRHQPGIAADLMRELAPLLAAEGIDLNAALDLETLQAALDRAIERRNVALFTPVGKPAT
jgi:hypothetical protein